MAQKLNNIVITGMPKSGKSTLLKTIIYTIRHKQGMFVEEVNANGNRIGFKIVTAGGETALLASIDGYSPVTVGKWYVHLNNLEYLIPNLQIYQKSDVLYLDEIGPMQIKSDSFKQLACMYLDAPNPLIATITMEYSDKFIQSIKNRPDVALLEIRPNSRTAALNEVQKHVAELLSQN